MQVLVTGGSGYLGQFVVASLATAPLSGGGSGGEPVAVAYTYARAPLADGVFPPSVRAFRVDLATGEGLDEVFAAAGPFGAVVNCAALSQPVACEKDPAAAEALNAPAALLAALARQEEATGERALLVHLSTDQARAVWGRARYVCARRYGASTAPRVALLAQHAPRGESVPPLPPTPPPPPPQ